MGIALWVISELTVFFLVTLTVLNHTIRINNSRKVIMALALGLSISIAFSYLTYLYAVPLDWIEVFPFFDLIMPSTWVVVVILSLAKGSGQLERYFPATMFILSPFSLYALAVLNWPWHVIRWVVFGMFFLSLIIYSKSKGAKGWFSWRRHI